MSNMIGGERAAVQNPFIKYAKEAGWEYLSPEQALELRGGIDKLVFRDLFASQLRKLNSRFMTSDISAKLIRDIELVQPNIKGNLMAWEYLKGLKQAFVAAEKRERNVRLIDYDEPEKNVFQVTDEFEFTNGTKTNRYDIVFLINGFPLLLVETKAAHKLGGMAQALEQVIGRYHRETPEMMALLQVYALTHIIQFYYSSTWSYSLKTLFNWKTEMAGKNYEDLVKSFIDKERVIRLIFDFILFTKQDDDLKKVILRPHQMRTVDKIIVRARDEEKNRGLVWHTQGSGKTYTMIVAAQKILADPSLKNPTVLLLVDRNELETQLFGNLESIGIENVEVARRKSHLRELFRQDKRGLIISMIHKFDKMPANISTRKNIFVLVDEAHRTTGGDLGNYLMGALPNATYIGFTGTPIDRTNTGRGTFAVFGRNDLPYGYLDKYDMKESIGDGTTLKLNYALAPSELRVDKATLEKEFLGRAEAEGVSDIETLNKILEKAVTLRNLLKNKERMQKVAAFVKKHYLENVEPMGYKAFLVGVDREACALYKKELDKILPKEYSKVVYSKAQNDEEELTENYLSEEEEKRIRKAFRKPDSMPKILIVTEKLLTGFDAPVLYCMYLDKPMRDHVLLQAIARVNRPYEDEQGKKKPAGFVLDFVGIFDNLEKALAFDSGDYTGIINDIELLKGHFTELMVKGEEYLGIAKKQTSADKKVEAVLEYFRDANKREEFYAYFKEVADAYEVLSPDAFLRPYIEEYNNLARFFRILREAYNPGVPLEKDFTKKTSELVRQHTKSGEIRGSLEVYEIDGDTLKRIEERNISDTEKVFNLLKSLREYCDRNKSERPYLISIGDKADLIAQMYQQRQLTTQQSLEELKAEIERANVARKEQADTKLPAELFTIYFTLKSENVGDPLPKVNELKGVFGKYPHWKRSEEQERFIRQEITKVLIKGGASVDRTTELVARVMRMLRSDSDGNA